MLLVVLLLGKVTCILHGACDGVCDGCSAGMVPVTVAAVSLILRAHTLTPKPVPLLQETLNPQPETVNPKP